MPSTEAHLNLAVHNIECACVLSNHAGYHDWVATICFYAALHIVEGFLGIEQPPQHSHSHAGRERLLRRETYRRIYRHYRRLSGAAHVARYLGRSNSFADYMSPGQVYHRLVQFRLVKVIQFGIELGTLTPSQAAQLNQGIQMLKGLSAPPLT